MSLALVADVAEQLETRRVIRCTSVGDRYDMIQLEALHGAASCAGTVVRGVYLLLLLLGKIASLLDQDGFGATTGPCRHVLSIILHVDILPPELLRCLVEEPRIIRDAPHTNALLVEVSKKIHLVAWRSPAGLKPTWG